ncbi:Condensation domain-containing protein [Kroppenstedtia eburnea]|uniref:Condensation domain-containing protein n=1 Tax=Kroppenstedtia eburnea TaxID=714067 RepID=A0A1N7LXY3_9BACL|nr:AMP-binding protein [Kroppenstedtia eburnea]SIS78686.1 Condensation domain-containing protein [Kroppenstedtia eburnea]
MNYLSKENVQGISELSLVQKAMLSGDQLTQVAYELQGNLDTKHAEQAWAETVAEHPSLRSVFRRLKNRTVQVLLKKRPIPIEWQDLRGMVKEDQQAAYQSIVNSHRKPIKIDEGPLIRLALCRLDDDQTILLWTHHPLCVDDNSRDMIVNEWLDRVQGTERAFPQRRSYQDYLKWEAAQDEMPAKKYWTEQLADFEPAPMLQTMPGVLEESDSHLRCCGTVLSEELSQRLEQVAKQYHVSVEALSLTAWTLLLNMYSGEERVSCGATVPGRPDACDGAESMIGSFAHALPLRATLSADQQVHELFACFQQQWERLLTFGNIPDEMVRTYAGISEKSLLFDSFVTVRNQTGGSSGQPQYLYRAGQEPMEVIITVGSQWEVELVRPQGVSLQALEVLRRHFVTLLKNIAEQPEAQLRELNLLSDEEELRILQKVNKTRLAAPPLHRLAHQVIEERVAERPDAIAAVCGEESITYGELNNRANQLAYWLRDQGLGRDDIAALLAERSIEMLVGILAVLKAGGAYVPLDSAHPDHRLLTILENSGAKFILTESRLQSRSLELSATLSQTPVVFSFDRGEGGGADVDVLTLYPEGNPALINEPEDLANVFYTSGSTGQPKGAMIEQIGMLNHLYAKINLLGLNEKSVVAQNASHCFDISVWQFLAPLMTGGRVVIYNNDISTDPQA